VEADPGALGCDVGDVAGGTVDAMVVFVGTGAVSSSSPPLLHPAITSATYPSIITRRSRLFEINYFSESSSVLRLQTRKRAERFIRNMRQATILVIYESLGTPSMCIYSGS
jgi:hypothetical protein